MSNWDTVLLIMSNVRDIQLDHFNDRMYFQKLGYLVQQIHHENSYDFSWYVRGPYSSALASSLFLHEEKGTYKKSSKLSESEIETKNKISELLGKQIKNPYSLELYASLWYLMSGKRISAKENDEIIRIMRKEKPHFQLKDIEHALEKISKFRQKYSI
ncbi:MAG: hypothetical protein OEM77_03490 [Nitrosopumilus sp.]|nr:hypothetical protein [Nitrosopumilus sp.]MDH3736129.1 hypothetical protein [Nitrosopumilus sp.]MDH3822550.1 hypothetical protein [Nitrosopumilus sp.]MDH3833288.1 hypothetical protein [Nitrosopumilus sp.]